VDKLNREIVAITESPAIREKLREQGVEADAMTPAQLGAHLQKEHDRWAKVIRDAKIQPE
jgi:tripartite-type tricarboxylate transporter receptor subunit TctC